MKHYIKVHETKQGYECELCGKMYITNKSFQEHLKRSHTNEKFICDICDKEYKNKFTLKHHIKAEHEKNTEKFSIQ